jgi:hypothetical protein
MTQTFTPTPPDQTAETFERMVDAFDDAANRDGQHYIECGYCEPTGLESPAARARLIAAAPDLLEAVLASEREYDEETAPVDPFCGECNLGTGPHRRTCAHHLRVAVIAKAGGAV